jgi:hypothetical protein
MKKLALRIAAAVLAAPGLALAAGGDTGTGAVAEMQVSPKQFGLILLAFVAFGGVIYVLAKFTMSDKKKDK